MATNYRAKIAEIRKCLDLLDEADLDDGGQKLVDVAWASAMVAASKKFESEGNKAIVVFKSRTDNGVMELELSKAAMTQTEQEMLDRFVSAMKSGKICSLKDETACIDKFKEVREILGYED